MTIREMKFRNQLSDTTGVFLREDGRTQLGYWPVEQPEDQHGGAERPRTAGRSGTSDVCTYSSPNGTDTVQRQPSTASEQGQPPSSMEYVPAWAPHGMRTGKTLPQDWVTPWEMPPP